MKGRDAFDVVVVGGGVNSLAAAAYLARGGSKVLVCERRASVGGSASTHEMEPGFRVDACRHDLGWIPPRMVRELALETHGLRMLPVTRRVAARGDDGEVLTFGPAGPDLDALRALSPRDAARWPAFAAEVEALAGFLEQLYAAPVPDVDLAAPGDLATGLRLALKFRGLGRRYMVEVLRVLPMSIAEWLDDWFECPLLKGALASRGIAHTSLGPRAAGTAFVFLHHHVGRRAGALGGALAPMGGVGAFAAALESAARAAGAEVRCGADVRRIVVKGGAVAGVELASGAVITATRVVSGASPRHTFLELCDPATLAPEFVHAVSRIRYRGAFASVNLTLSGRPAMPRDETAGIVVAPTTDYLERAADDAKYGRVSTRPFISARLPSLLDDTLAPAGKHVLSAHVQYAPYHLREGRWDDAGREALGDRVMDTLERYLPGLKALVRQRQVLAPPDFEREYGLPEGHVYHGEMALDQALFMRPVPACSHYRSPVRGLYVCGPGAHPGGGTAGAAGINAARAVLAD